MTCNTKSTENPGAVTQIRTFAIQFLWLFENSLRKLALKFFPIQGLVEGIVHQGIFQWLPTCINQLIRLKPVNKTRKEFFNNQCGALPFFRKNNFLDGDFCLVHPWRAIAGSI